MMLTKNEINTWFGYNSNHDESTRDICDQAILAAQLEQERDAYRIDCVRSMASEAALLVRIQQLEDEIKVLNFELMSAQTGVEHSYRKGKP